MKIPSHRRFRTKGGEQRLTLNGRVVPILAPICEACGTRRKRDEPDTYHVFFWEDERDSKLAVTPMTFCYPCAIDFSRDETCELGYISHVELVDSGMENLVIFPATKGQK